jgi:hypothetical protein
MKSSKAKFIQLIETSQLLKDQITLQINHVKGHLNPHQKTRI